MNGPVVSLREVTRATVRAVCELNVTPAQSRSVASAAVSIAEASFSPEAWFRAIYADDVPVGFVMLSVRPEVPEYCLWRFLVDARHQGRGLGAAALQLVIEHVRGLGAHELTLSYVPGGDSPEPFYRKLGFTPTGAVEDGELVMRLAL